ncbi:hypothetical protein, partial [Burkholderia cenocepacia]|uniref:hypothetical protein n=1 Tax=Burkholderia cenocepacia TaxID=95486 RepID=UPI001C4DED71
LVTVERRISLSTGFLFGCRNKYEEYRDRARAVQRASAAASNGRPGARAAGAPALRKRTPVAASEASHSNAADATLRTARGTQRGVGGIAVGGLGSRDGRALPQRRGARRTRAGPAVRCGGRSTLNRPRAISIFFILITATEKKAR